MKAILTKYLPPTNVRGARIKAWAEGGNSCTISYPHEFSGAATHAEAALALCRKLGWTGALIAGGTPDGYVFVFLEGERFNAESQSAASAATPRGGEVAK